MQTIKDPYFRVEVLAQTPNPQQLIWLSAHQCVCEGAAIDDPLPSEENAGEYVVKHLLAGDRGHFSPLEAPQISFNVIGFPHSVMQQVRTHRIGVHFSVQSFRYTGDRLFQAEKELQKTNHLNVEAIKAVVEPVFYLRPIGSYSDRDGKHYEYTEDRRLTHIRCCIDALEQYADDIACGLSEEHARGLIPFDVRQHWVMSFNVRSLMHLLDLRTSKAAQLECQQLCDLLLEPFQKWCPSLAAWYTEKRWAKARLSP